MSYYKILHKSSIVSVLAVCGFMGTADAADIKWNGNDISKQDEFVTGGVLKIDADNDNQYNNIDVDGVGISNNKITIVKKDAPLGSDIFGQGAGLYVTGKINEMDADFTGNEILVQYDQAGKATTNGGALAVYQGGSINEIDGDFINNKITAEYTGEGDSKYTGSAVISAGGGAIHIEGKWGEDQVEANSYTKIDKIDGSFVGNSATGDGYASGGAIYVKAGKNTSVKIGRIEGDFVNNKVEAKTADSSVKATTGGAISLKVDRSGSEDIKGEIIVAGDFIGNSAITNATDAFGGAVYNEGRFIAGGNFINNKAESKTGNALGGAIYNKGTATVFNSVISGNSAQQGGAIYNDVDGAFVLQGKNVLKNNKIGEDSFNDIYNLGHFAIRSGTTTVSGGIDGTGHLLIEKTGALNIGTTTLTQGSLDLQGTIYLSVVDENNYGKINISDEITLGDGGKLAISISKDGTYKLFDGQVIDIANISAGGGIYSMTDAGEGSYTFTLKDSQSIAADTGLSGAASAALVAMIGGEGEIASKISMSAQQVLGSGNVQQAQHELDKALPEDKPAVRSVVGGVQNQAFNLAAGRMGHSAGYGRNGGDEDKAKYGFWAQGLLNKTKIDGDFTGETSGLSVGADALIANKHSLGFGYAFNTSDLSSAGRDTDVESHTIFAYGQYKPNNWYANLVLNYTFADYQEYARVFGVALDADYKSNSFGGQVATGYNFSTGITPEVAIRYLHINQDSYDNGLSKVEEATMDYMTGVAGLKYSFMVESGTDVIWWPELMAAATYDFIAQDGQAVVNIPGASPYVIEADGLSRFGGQFGLGLTAEYRKLKVSLNYLIDVREDYNSQTGMLKFRYTF